jgi:hypothetical protein
MMRLFPFLLLFFLLTRVLAQVYPLHPSVGDTLDRLEKLDYSLFPEVNNQGFNYAVIQYRENNFYLDAGYENKDSLQSFLLSQENIIEAQQNIEKINAYYRYEKEAEKKTSSSNSLNSSSKINNLRLDGPMSEQMKKESRMNVRLEEDARRMQEFQQGLRPREIHIEFK